MKKVKIRVDKYQKILIKEEVSAIQLHHSEENGKEPLSTYVVMLGVSFSGVSLNNIPIIPINIASAYTVSTQKADILDYERLLVEDKVVYYGLRGLHYILKYTFNVRKGERPTHTMSVYVPTKDGLMLDLNEMYLTQLTHKLPIELVNYMDETFLEFAKARLKAKKGVVINGV